jgi:hypothetical protein
LGSVTPAGIRNSTVRSVTAMVTASPFSVVTAIRLAWTVTPVTAPRTWSAAGAAGWATAGTPASAANRMVLVSFMNFIGRCAYLEFRGRLSPVQGYSAGTLAQWI